MKFADQLNDYCWREQLYQLKQEFIKRIQSQEGDHGIFLTNKNYLNDLGYKDVVSQ